jgi:MSHA biogenesis protein MshN
MALARLQVETGDVNGALITLEQGLTYAKNNGNYQVFLATLLQRANRHEEAIAQYQAALSLNSASNSATSNALVGLGISLQAMDKLKESQEAFSRAQSSATLSPELLSFVEQRIKQIQQRLQN